MDIYRDRTCTERVNNRILNDYVVHSLTCRDEPKHFLFAAMACVSIRLDNDAAVEECGKRPEAKTGDHGISHAELLDMPSFGSRT